MNTIANRAASCYALEWSRSQKCFHVAPLLTVFKKNLESIVTGADPGYLVIGLFETQQEADECIASLREKFLHHFAADVATDAAPSEDAKTATV